MKVPSPKAICRFQEVPSHEMYGTFVYLYIARRDGSYFCVGKCSIA